MRASRILLARQDNPLEVIAQLCTEREEPPAPTHPPQVPPAPPYTVGARPGTLSIPSTLHAGGSSSTRSPVDSSSPNLTDGDECEHDRAPEDDDGRSASDMSVDVVSSPTQCLYTNVNGSGPF